jgi:polar amino acid transport system substrate-binding protein
MSLPHFHPYNLALTPIRKYSTVLLLLSLGLTIMSVARTHAENTLWVWDHIAITSFRVIAEPVADRSETAGKGLYWDLLKTVYEPLNIHIKTAIAPRKSAQKLVSDYQEYMAIAGEYRNAPIHLLYPRYPLEDESLYVLAHKYRVSPQTIHSLEQWQGLNVSWLRGKDLLIPLEYGFRLVEYDSVKEGLDLLSSELTDIVIAKQHLVDQLLSSIAPNDRAFHLTAFTHTKSLYLGFQPSPISESLIEIYNRRIEWLAQKGELTPIYARWQTQLPSTIKAITKPNKHERSLY